jgi:putative transferase (TIGR04331 family)
MVARFLITTAEEATWRTDAQVLFLGEWCKLYSRKHIWERLDYDVVPYHWDDREKLYSDYLYLQRLYESFLSELSVKLNEIHGVNHTLRYWRILIGPWLGFYFIPMVFDRWEMIQNAVKRYKISGAHVIEGDISQLVPSNMNDFLRLFIGDQWNQVIYSYLLEHWTDVYCEPVVIGSHTATNCAISYSNVSMRQRFRHFIGNIMNKMSTIRVRQDEAFFIADYLTLRESLALQWQIGQLPRLWRPVAPPSVSVNSEFRRWRLNDKGNSNFEQALRALIPLQIPTVYLEGYGDLKKQVSLLPWPQRPRFIFTSNSYDSDDVFNAWVAEKTEANVPLVIGQHGGSYGAALWNFTEEHELAISDAWLSWGWEENSGKNKIKPVGNLKMFGRRLNWDPKGCALMVEMAMSRYIYHMYSVPVASQWLDYFDDQVRFVDALPQNLREELLIRLYGQDYGWCQKQRWQDRFPQIHLDDGIVPIAELVKKSRIYISTYNATTFLESLVMNVPTIIFWNPKHWELRASAQPYFDRLKEVGIFHGTPESAADKMMKVWDDVPNWWHQSEIQEARLYFCNHFSRLPKNPLNVLKNALTTVKSGAIY